MAEQKYRTNIGAAIAGIRDLRETRKRLGGQPVDIGSMQGKKVLVTGASSGLGLSISKELASLGAHVFMMCRRPATEELNLVRESGKKAGGKAEVITADMTDFSSLFRAASELKKRKVQLDIMVSNAAVVCSSEKKTVDGFEEMLQVNAISPALLISELLNNGVIPNRTFTHSVKSTKIKSGGFIPRIVVIASEAHRTADDLKLEAVFKIESYGMSESTNRYGWTKLHLLTFVRELTRRLSDKKQPDVSVHAMCPGPVASNLAREMPAIAKPFAGFLFKLFFQTPDQAAKPALYLCTSNQLEGKTGRYQFLMEERNPSVSADDPKNGKAVWNLYRKIIEDSKKNLK